MKVEHFHIYLLTNCIFSSVNCLSKSIGSWLSGETVQGWNGCPWDVVSPPSLEAFKGQAGQSFDEGSLKEIHIAGVGLV